jgi:hypothetical protein
MSRDPFDSLRAGNPVPPENLPNPPMAVARAITARQPSLRRGLAIAAATAALVLAGGGSWLLWSRGGTLETAVQATTTTAGSTSTTTLAPGLSDAPLVTVYFLDADEGDLVAVARNLDVLNVRPLPDLGPLALDLLLWGPGSWDAGPLPEPVATAEAGLTTAVPEGTELRSLEVADGVALVDLSAEFAGASPEALAQVVFTATRLEGVAAVRFLIEGGPQYLIAEPLSLTPAAGLPAGATIIDPATRLAFEDWLPPIAIEMPALGGDFQSIAVGVAYPAGATIGLSLHDSTGATIWAGNAATVTCGTPWSNCRGEGDWSVFTAVVEGSIPTAQWLTLTAFLYDEQGNHQAEISYPVWWESARPPEVTTTTGPISSTTSTTAIAGRAAPWSRAPLAADEVPALVRTTWAAAEDPERCPVLFPADPASLADEAVLHDRYFGSDWGLAWDLPSGPGRWEPGGEYCADCGREAFGVAGTYFPGLEGDEDSIWPNRLAWSDASTADDGQSHAGYGYEGLSPTGERGEPLLAYLFVSGRDCMYNVWSFLGEDHLLTLIDQLRFVEEMGAP